MIFPIATTDATIALIAAGGAVVGAAVGGLGSYFVERKLGDRRAAAVARAGARVVASDLKHIDDVFRKVEEDGRVWPFQKLPTPGWDEYRDDLALALDPDDWRSVSSEDLSLSRESRSAGPTFGSERRYCVGDVGENVARSATASRSQRGMGLPWLNIRS